MVSEIGADLMDIVCDQRRIGKDLAVDLLQDKVALLTADEPGTIDEAATMRDDLAGTVVEAVCRKDRVQHGRIFDSCSFGVKLREDWGLMYMQTVAPKSPGRRLRSEAEQTLAPVRHRNARPQRSRDHFLEWTMSCPLITIF